MGPCLRGISEYDDRPLHPAAAEEVVPDVKDSVEVVGGGAGKAEGEVVNESAERTSSEEWDSD